MKKLIVLSIIAIIMYACNSGGSNETTQTTPTTTTPDPNGEKISTPGGDAPAYDLTVEQESLPMLMLAIN